MREMNYLWIVESRRLIIHSSREAYGNKRSFYGFQSWNRSTVVSIEIRTEGFLWWTKIEALFYISEYVLSKKTVLNGKSIFSIFIFTQNILQL